MTLGTLVRVFAGLLSLLALAALATLVPEPWSLPFSLAISTIQLTLIFTYFMQLCRQDGMVRVFAVAGFFWLAMGGVLTLADYLTRG